MSEETIVRQNMINDKNYTPYCGNRDACSGRWPRTKWINGGLECPACGYRLKFDPDFFERYKVKWGIDTNIQEKPSVSIVSGSSGRTQHGETYGYAINKAVRMAAIASSMGFVLSPGINSLFKENKPKNKCLLPECNNLTNHNKGYCSPECFKKRKTK